MAFFIHFVSLVTILSFNATAQNYVVVKDVAHNTMLNLSCYMSDNPNNSKISLTVYRNGKGICSDGNSKIYVDFKERNSDGKRLSFDVFNQDKFNCKGHYSFSIKADSVSPDSVFGGYNMFYNYCMLTTKTLYAIIVEPSSGGELVRINIDANSALQIRNLVKKYIVKTGK
jgi:hypothetical protein